INFAEALRLPGDPSFGDRRGGVGAEAACFDLRPLFNARFRLLALRRPPVLRARRAGEESGGDERAETVRPAAPSCSAASRESGSRRHVDLVNAGASSMVRLALG